MPSIVPFSTHFRSTEFEHGPSIPEENYPAFEFLCQKVLEPVREWAGVAFYVTSGHRSPESNAAAGGQPDSEHISTPKVCAADFQIIGQNWNRTISLRAIFDKMRMDPTIPFHQLILEHDRNGLPVCIHVSINLDKPGVRSVLEGMTHNQSKYTPAEHVDFNPSGIPSAKDEADA